MPSDALTIILPTTCREDLATCRAVLHLPLPTRDHLTDLSREIAERGFSEIVQRCDLLVYDDVDLAASDEDPAGDEIVLHQGEVRAWRERYHQVAVQNSDRHHLVVDGHGLVWVRHTMKHREGDTWTSPACPIADILSIRA